MVSKGGFIDFGYAHLFVKDVSINQTNAAGTRLGYPPSFLMSLYTHTFEPSTRVRRINAVGPTIRSPGMLASPGGSIEAGSFMIFTGESK
jgi:hypothetical protein